MIKAVLIDIDDTLLDFEGFCIEAMKDGFAYFGLRPYEDWMIATFNRINGALWQEIERGELTLPQLREFRWQRIFKAFDIDFDGAVFEDYFRRYLFDCGIPVTGSYELLEALHGHYHLYVVSNGPYKQQLNRLEKANMLHYFDDVFVSEQVGYQKPLLEFFDYCFQRIPFEKDEIIIIGDSLTSDMAGGREAGIKTCLFDRYDRYSNGEDVDLRVTTLAEIPSLLEKM
ncbi:MAG: YjjG family noncanonical pyrimidine nucleotidase [Erysipelotrichaceae bacterium]|nr:YjjG family noncanonical pyrimidine nucleotidase [Erysipelotrichaceae bacterium]